MKGSVSLFVRSLFCQSFVEPLPSFLCFGGFQVLAERLRMAELDMYEVQACSASFTIGARARGAATFCADAPMPVEPVSAVLGQIDPLP